MIQTQVGAECTASGVAQPAGASQVRTTTLKVWGSGLGFRNRGGPEGIHGNVMIAMRLPVSSMGSNNEGNSL